MAMGEALEQQKGGAQVTGGTQKRHHYMCFRMGIYVEERRFFGMAIPMMHLLPNHLTKTEKIESIGLFVC